MVHLTRCPARHEHPQTALWVVHVRSDDGPVAPRGGDGAVTRTTGATDAQLNAALTELTKPNAEGWSSFPLAEKRNIQHVAPALCTTEERIVRVDDLKRLTDFFEYNILNADYKDHESYDRIIEAIGEAE